MKYLCTKLFPLLVFVLIVSSCSEDQESRGNYFEYDGGGVYHLQAVTVFNNAAVEQEQYIGTLGDVEVILTKNGMKNLTFVVPPDAPTGPSVLDIPELSQRVNFMVSEVVFSQTPDEILGELIQNLQDYSNAVAVPNIPEKQTSLSIIENFNAFYADATPEEKEMMAKVYIANKAAYDSLIYSALAMESGKFDPYAFAKESLNMFEYAVPWVAAGVGIFAAADWFISHPGLFTTVKLMGAVLAGVAIGLSAESFVNFIGARAVAAKARFTSMVGTTMTVLDNVAQAEVFKTFRRPVNNTDEGSDAPLLKSFFNMHGVYTGSLIKLNNAIQYINNNLPFGNIQLLTVRNVPATSVEAEEELTEEIFNQLEFSISGGNLQLVSASLSNGQLNVKVKTVGAVSEYPVSGTLNWTYSDEFSGFNGSVPVNIEASIVGTWHLLSFQNGVPAGTYVPNYHPLCPQIKLFDYTYENEIVVFNANQTFTITAYEIYIWNNVQINEDTCQITDNQPDSTETPVNTAAGTYSIGGSNLTFHMAEDSTVPFSFLDYNKIKIGDMVYVRM